jgi:Glutamyl-tRNA reductase
MKENKIVFIGAGNLATNVAEAFHDRHIKIAQIYSRTEDSARTLAKAVEADYTTELESVINDADIYIVALKDDALVELMPQIIKGKKML